MITAMDIAGVDQAMGAMPGQLAPCGRHEKSACCGKCQHAHGHRHVSQSAAHPPVRSGFDVMPGRAVGVGLGLKNSGLGNGFLEIVRAVVRFEVDGTVEVRHCWTEMGQGVHTVAAQVAVEELGIDPERIRVVVDTTRELGAGQTTG